MNRLEQLKKLAEIEPNDPLSHYGVGLECLNLQDWAGAAAAFDRAIQVEPDYSAAYYHKARAQIQAGDSTGALRTLEQGITISRKHGDWKTAGEMQELLDTVK